MTKQDNLTAIHRMTKTRTKEPPPRFEVRSSKEFQFVYLSYRGEPSFTLKPEEAMALGAILMSQAEECFIPATTQTRKKK